MNNALLYFGGLLVVTLAALFAVPHFIDWNGYRGVFEEEASKVLGRDVRVGGAVNVRLLPTPFVRFEKVRLADPTGQTGEPFVRVDSFTMRLSGPALLRGVLEANEIELHRPVLTLALDDKGGGNWSSVQIKAGALPFVPQDVALHSVKLIDGVVALFNAEAQQIARAESVNGEFSADALKGPFKFKGQAQWSGEMRDIKFATTAPGPDGAFQIKASLRAEKSGTSYAVDGRVEDVSGKPRITGELSGKLPLSTASAAAVASDVPNIELKSRFDANTAGAKVEDITLSVENAAEPQLITGTATAVWGKDPRLDVALASKWLDLDRLAGAGQDSATFVKVKQLGLSLMRGLAGDGAAGAKIAIDQVKLGGETAGGLTIDAERRGTAVQLKQLKAGLPGGSRLDLSGDLKDDGGKVSFAGTGYVHGSNVARLLAWAAKSGADLDVNASGPFSAEGRVLLTDTRFELTEASADFGGRAFSGDVVVSGEGRRRVAVTIEANRLDSSELFPETSRALEDKLRHAFGFAALARTAVPPADAAAGEAAAANDAGDISVRVLAGELKHGDQSFRNVDATVGLDAGNIRIPAAKFTTAGGLAVNLDARIDSAAQKSTGTLSYDLAALTPDALKDFAALTGLGSVVSVDRLAQMGSAKIAGLVRLGTRGPATADISLDGLIKAAHVSGTAQFDGGLQGWRKEPSRLQLSARATGLNALLAAFGIDAGAVAQPSAHEAELVYASTGALASGAAAMLEISAPGFDAAYSGGLAMPGDTPLAMSGVLSVKANDLLDVVAVAGLPAVRGAAGVPVDGRLDIKRDGAGWSIAARQFKAGSSNLSGVASLVPKADGPSVLSADIKADTLTLAALLSPILDKPAALQAGAQPAAKGEIWPDAVFNFDALAGVTGDVRLRFGALRVQPDIAARNGTLKLALQPGKAAITELAGQAIGGALTGTMQLTKQPGGIAFDGGFKIDGGDLAKLASSAQGKATLDVKATAQALSPAALIAVLNGSGTLTLEAARVAAPGPALASAIVADVLANKIPNQPEDVTDALRTRVQSAAADLGSRTMAITIADGIAKFESLSLETSGGNVTAITLVDLMSLSIDSAWKLAAIVPPLPPPAEDVPGWISPPPKGPLPSAAIVYTGRLNALSALNVSVDAADMQRELAVRQMERNVEELERIRRLDEHRAKLEQERRRVLDAERAAAAAAAATAKASNTTVLPDGQAPLQPPVQPSVQPPGQAMPPVVPESAGTAPQPQSSTTPAGGGAAPPITVTIEPAPITPAAERPATRPQAARTPPSRPPAERRSTTDEVFRSLGGVP